MFVKKLQALHPDKKLMIIWDGASYHRCKEVRDYLSEVNQGLEEKIGKWLAFCLRRMLRIKIRLKMFG